MRTNRIIAGTILVLAYPLAYYTWVMTIKNTWLENDIIDHHPDILRPQAGRFSYRDPTKEFEEACVFSKIKDIEKKE